MAIDFSALRKQKEMIDQILQLASDPEAASLLEKLIVGKGDAPAQPKPLVMPQREPRVARRKAQSVRSGQRGAQIAAVRKAIAARSGGFFVGDIGDDLRAAGIDIDNVAVSRVLQRLADQTKELFVAVRGVGKHPHRYEKTEAFRAA